jgi:DNA processing protein
MKKELIYQIAINHIPGIGGVTARRLISYCGGVEAVFKEKLHALKKIPGVGDKLASAIRRQDVFERAEQEIKFIEKHHIRPLFFLDDDYPYRLKQCEDGPMLIFVRGNADLNRQKVLAVIGTRNITSYGREQCEAFVNDLAPYEPLIVSGLAYGVDACAHKAALKHNLPTAAVLGHGLDRIYPQAHTGLAKQIVADGALVTDFLTGTKPDRENFPKRNRIIAGLCDGIVVIEAAITGGALITANIANTYNRDVFALPGRINDQYSQGCNKLIRINKAHLMESVADLQYIMNWQPGNNPKKGIQTNLFVSLSEEEKTITSFLKEKNEAGIDQIVAGTGFNLSKTTTILLSLEFKDVVKPLPGKMFRLNARV